MLVKLGDIWVDPLFVVFMEPSTITQTSPNGDSVTMNCISVITTNGSARTIGNIDEFASIINNAGQSFGGEDEKPEEV